MLLPLYLPLSEPWKLLLVYIIVLWFCVVWPIINNVKTGEVKLHSFCKLLLRSMPVPTSHALGAQALIFLSKLNRYKARFTQWRPSPGLFLVEAVEEGDAQSHY